MGSDTSKTGTIYPKQLGGFEEHAGSECSNQRYLLQYRCQQKYYED